MKIYINSEEKYKDTRSTGISFTIVGCAGILLLVCLWLNVLPIHFDFINKILITSVMGCLFLIFLIIGIKSFASLKKISETGERQNNLEKEISDWFIEEYKDQMLVQFDDSFEDDAQEIYFQRYNFIFDTIKDYYSDVNEELIDHISEDIYNLIYSEK